MTVAVCSLTGTKPVREFRDDIGEDCIGKEQDCGLGSLDDLCLARTKLDRAPGMSEELWQLPHAAKSADGHELPLSRRETWAREHAAISKAENEISKIGIERSDLLEQLVAVSRIDAVEVLSTPGHAYGVAESFGRGSIARRQDVGKSVQCRQSPGKARVGNALDAGFTEGGSRQSFGETELRCCHDGILFTATKRSEEGDQDTIFERQTLLLAEGLQSFGERHASSIRLVLLLFLLFFSGCAKGQVSGLTKEPSKAHVALRVAYHRDPIVVPGEGSISRREFHSYVVRHRAGPWLRLLAFSKELRREISASGLRPPSHTLVRKFHAWVRDGALSEFLPAANPPWKSIKAELDASWVLARLWVLGREPAGGVDLPKSKQKFLTLFATEMKVRKPELHSPRAEHLATCGLSSVGLEEIYPDILALLSPEERDRLLLAAVRR